MKHRRLRWTRRCGALAVPAGRRGVAGWDAALRSATPPPTTFGPLRHRSRRRVLDDIDPRWPTAPRAGSSSLRPARSSSTTRTCRRRRDRASCPRSLRRCRRSLRTDGRTPSRSADDYAFSPPATGVVTRPEHEVHLRARCVRPDMQSSGVSFFYEHRRGRATYHDGRRTRSPASSRTGKHAHDRR